jgi:hypothetical protein
MQFNVVLDRDEGGLLNALQFLGVFVKAKRNRKP